MLPRPARTFLDAVTVGRRIATLAPTRSAKLRVLVTAVRFAIGRKLGRPGPLTTLSLRKFDRSFTLAVDQYGDLAAILEVLVGEEYELPAIERPRAVLDAGAHIGAATAYFKCRYPEAHVYAIEPDPGSLSKLERNAAQFEGVTVVRAALAQANGEATLFSGGGSMGSSLRRDGEGSRTRVAACSLDELVATHAPEGIDILKLDIEGLELEVMAAFSGLAGVRAVVGEVHPDLIGAPVEAFLGLLEDFEIETDWPSPLSCTFKAMRRQTASGGAPAPNDAGPGLRPARSQ